MKNKSFAIIGGGLTGCASALYLKNQGYNVTIYEKDNELGGITKDLNFDKQNYLNGPNYLAPSSLLIEQIKKEKFLKKLISIKQILYGSYTDIFGEKNISNDFAHPVSPEKFKKKNFFSNKNKNLLERIRQYPHKTSGNLISWCSKFDNELEKIHPECSHVLGLGRLNFRNSEKEILKLKKRSKFFDDLLGIPNLNKVNNKFCIPKNGYNSFFKNLQKFFIKKRLRLIFVQKYLLKKRIIKLI